MKQKAPLPLPIDPYLSEIVKAHQDYSTLLIKASPGSGKTTRLPWAIALHSQKKVLVLEPRRLAAKLAAFRIASEQEVELGKEVGYHFRFERKTSPDSRLIFYTEGTFLRLMVSDSELKDVGTVILDEFHERHLETDLALAALRNLQEKSGLKIILMSATLDTKIKDYFSEAKTFDIEAPNFPVQIHYLPNVPSVLNQRLESKIKNALASIKEEGDVLVFVPGMREMLQTKDYLGADFGEVLLLHADLSKDEQERALSSLNRRKIILGTNIAESSVTIPGIKFVIDSGIQREAHYSPWSGLKFLQDRPITQSSAIQRAGRAGRTSPGECFRLYSEMDFKERENHTIPEVLKADLTDTVLLAAELKKDLHWLTPPPPQRLKAAQDLAFKMNALNEKSELTSLGKKMSSYPLDARLARSLVAGETLESSARNKLLRFVVQEIEGDYSGTLMNRLQFFLQGNGKEENWEKALLTGFVDQVSRYRKKTHDFIHYSGKTIKAHHSLSALQDGLYIIFDVSQRQEAMLVLSIEEEWLYDIEPFPFTEENSIEVRDKILIKTSTKLGSLVFDEASSQKKWSDLAPDLRYKIVELTLTPFRKKLDEWKKHDLFGRFAFWAKQKSLQLSDIEEKLTPNDYFSQNDELDFENLNFYFKEKLESALEITGIESELPTKIDLGGRRELVIHYEEGQDPYVEAAIQDFYGQKITPTILKGKFPLTIKLLGPHKRPIQVTKDLVGFWNRTYPEMKKEYQRDYPRHYWPDDPMNAKPILLKKNLT
jgi:ATP-dependent helicase HrpB